MTRTYNVLDLEATCWFPRDTNRGQEPEIIAVGLSRLTLVGQTAWRPPTDYKVERLDFFYVMPEMSTVSEFCTRLTGITQSVLDREGLPLKMAMDRIREQCCGDAWASFGPADLTLLRNCCGSANRPFFGSTIQFPFSGAHIDIQQQLGTIYPVSLQSALELFGLTFQGKPHNAADDALNASRVLGEVITRRQNVQSNG